MRKKNQMKRNKKEFQILKYLIKDKFIILTSIITILITCLISKYTVIQGDSLLNNYIFATGGGWFSFIILIMFFITFIYLHNRLDFNYSYRIRKIDSKSTSLDIIKFSIIINSSIYIIVLILNILLLIPNSNLNGLIRANNIIYFIFYILRNFTIYNTISALNYAIFKFIDKKMSILLTFLTAYLCYMVTPSNKMISSLLNIKLNPACYLIKLNYSSFFFEIIITLLYISILFTTTATIFNFYTKRGVDDEI